MNCEKCGSEMKLQEFVYISDPVQYGYKCPKCGNVQYSMIKEENNQIDYEKKYKEAILRAKAMLKVAANEKEAIDYVSTIFPELKESEDERIRKALVRFHKSTIDIDGIKGADIIAWLEMQGNNTPTIIWHNIDEKPEEMKELFCEWESDDSTWHDVAFYDEESHTFRHAKMPINVTKWVYVDELLEKQSEQKPAVTDFNAKDWYVSKVDGKIHDMTYNPADKVEPKFKIGDVLCDKSCTTLDKNSQPNIKILDIRNGMYICNNCSFPISQQDEYELVTKKNEPQYAWSDEDEKMANDLIEGFQSQVKVYNLVHTSKEIADWLKSLKNRVQPQVKEWSEEDELVVLSIEQVIKAASLLNIVPEKLDKIDKWLKSLKDRIGG